MKLDEMKKDVLKAVQEMSPAVIPDIVEATGISYEMTRKIVSTLHANGLLCKGTAVRTKTGDLLMSWKVPQGKIDQIRDFLYRKD